MFALTNTVNTIKVDTNEIINLCRKHKCMISHIKYDMNDNTYIRIYFKGMSHEKYVVKIIKELKLNPLLQDAYIRFYTIVRNKKVVSSLGIIINGIVLEGLTYINVPD